MIILDTNVVSELVKPHPHPSVCAWMSTLPIADIAVSAVTVAAP